MEVRGSSIVIEYPSVDGIPVQTELKERNIIDASSQDVQVDAYGSGKFTVAVKVPKDTGNFQLIAEIEVGDEAVKSIREFAVD